MTTTKTTAKGFENRMRAMEENLFEGYTENFSKGNQIAKLNMRYECDEPIFTISYYDNTKNLAPCVSKFLTFVEAFQRLRLEGFRYEGTTDENI